jgi:1-acyl-sn-glycerol-3-phosphate acyltransferase
MRVEAPWGRPDTGPVVLAANHSNALGDVAVLLAQLRRFPRFLAATTWWRHGPVRALFDIAGVLPVHRARDGGGTERNESTFEECTRALAAGDQLAVFPEGELNLDAELRPLKTGAARIALAAGAHGVEGVEIVPVGLAYEDRGRFGSRAVLRFGEPIRADEHLSAYLHDPQGTVRQVTAVLQDRLQRAAAPPLDRDTPAAACSGRDGLLRAALLAPVAAVGLASWAPALAGASLAARAASTESWQATVKGLCASLLLPLGWVAETTLLARRIGRLRAAALVSTGAISGRAGLRWLENVRGILERR